MGVFEIEASGKRIQLRDTQERETQISLYTYEVKDSKEVYFLWKN